MSLPELAIRNRTMTVFVTLTLVVAGIGAFFSLGQLEDPDFTIKVAAVSTIYPGATAREVEQDVTDRIETKLQELKQIDHLESFSRDGLSVINGRPASEKSVGYLVDARSSITIKGWRRDKDTVAAFTFENRENSYAARRGYRDNIGVIGLVAFEEQGLRTLEDVPMTFAMPYKGKRDSATPGGTGTGWGHDIGSSVVEVPFTRSANKQTVTIYYDTPEALRRLGVPVDGWNPKPFPADTAYAPPPPKR